MTRLLKIEPQDIRFLQPDDQCFHLREYTAGGGFRQGETNQQIINLKCKPTANAGRLHHKKAAVNFWADRLREALDLGYVAGTCTLIPVPSSKRAGDPEYDDRMLGVLKRLAEHHTGLDVRALLSTTSERPAQHEGGRLKVDQLFESMSVSSELLHSGLRSTIILVDDVFTMGATFKAAQRHLRNLEGVRDVVGIFLAKTVWPTADSD